MFLEKLDFLMKSHGLNKHTMSQACGVPYTTIDAFYKKGYENAKLSTLRKLCKYFDVSLDYLIDESCNTVQFNPDAMEVAKKYSQLPADGKLAVQDVIKRELRYAGIDGEESAAGAGIAADIAVTTGFISEAEAVINQTDNIEKK